MESHCPLHQNNQISPTTDLFRPYLARHANLRGIGDERPTALEIVHDLKAEETLKDAVILITGCSAGLGIETARALYLTGAKLYLTFRNIDKGQTAIKAITADAPIEQKIEFLNLDLGDLESVRSAAAEFKSRSNKLNILINNAGRLNPTPSFVLGAVTPGYECGRTCMY